MNRVNKTERTVIFFYWRSTGTKTQEKNERRREKRVRRERREERERSAEIGCER
jgi:hypothetical protein